MQKLRLALWVMIGIGTLAGLYGAALRFSAESKNRTVELTLDMTELQKIATAEGKPLSTVLKRFKDAGMTSVAITEDTLGSLEESRLLEVLPTTQSNTSYLMVHQRNYERVVAALKQRTRLGSQLNLPPGIGQTNPMDAGLTIPHTFQTLKSIGVGLNPELLRFAQHEAHKLHLGVVGRVTNTNNISAEGIRWTLQQLQKQKVKTVIFAGDDVLGYDSQLSVTAEAFRELGLQYGTVEFSKMKGDAALHRKLTDRTIRVHTVLGTEMATATPEDNIQRFSLAARERNIRLLYVRLFLEKANTLEENVRYVEKIARSVERGGLKVGLAHPYVALSMPLWVRGFLGIGLAGALLLLLEELCSALTAPRSPALVAGALGALLLLALPLVRPNLAALAAAILFASLAVCQRGLLAPIPWGEPQVGVALRRLVQILGFATLGIVSIVGLLADRLFLVKADAFVGIKAALYLPLLMATLVWAAGLRADSPAELWSKTRLQVQRLALLINEPIRLWQVGAGLGILVVLGMLWLRSGNDGAAVVSGFELRFRDILDATLPVRPRFKALLFAPLLMGIYYCGRGDRLWGLPLFLLGVIAVTDYINTFCHLHIPLLVSVMRDTLGTLLGAVLGILILQLVQKYLKKPTRAGDAS